MRKIYLLLVIVLAALMLAGCGGERGEIKIISPNPDQNVSSFLDAGSVTTPEIVVNSTFASVKDLQVLLDGVNVATVVIAPGINNIPGVTIASPGGHVVVLLWQKDGTPQQANINFIWHPPTGTDRFAMSVANIVGAHDAASGYLLIGAILVIAGALVFMFIGGKATNNWQGLLVGGGIGAFVAIIATGLVMYDSASDQGAIIIQTATGGVIGLLFVIVIVWLLSRLSFGHHRSEMHPDGSFVTSATGLALTGKSDVPVKALDSGFKTTEALGGLVGRLAGGQQYEPVGRIRDHNE